MQVLTGLQKSASHGCAVAQTQIFGRRASEYFKLCFLSLDSREIKLPTCGHSLDRSLGDVSQTGSAERCWFTPSDGVALGDTLFGVHLCR